MDGQLSRVGQDQVWWAMPRVSRQTTYQNLYYMYIIIKMNNKPTRAIDQPVSCFFVFCFFFCGDDVFTFPYNEISRIGVNMLN